MKKTTLLTSLAFVAATAVFAHQGVQNATVMARMVSMSALADNMKVLGTMAKGAVAFDADKARLAAKQIAEHAAQTPDLFEANETDPKSEALPVIWENFEDFSTKSDNLAVIARTLSTGIESPGDLPAAMRDLGTSCQACHSVYRK